MVLRRYLSFSSTHSGEKHSLLMSPYLGCLKCLFCIIVEAGFKSFRRIVVRKTGMFQFITVRSMRAEMICSGSQFSVQKKYHLFQIGITRLSAGSSN